MKSGLATSTYAIPRRRIFFILQCFFNIFYESRIFVEFVETKQNMKKFFSYFDGQVGIPSLPQPSWVPLSKSQDVLKQYFKNFLNACLHVLNEQTNKQT